MGWGVIVYILLLAMGVVGAFESGLTGDWRSANSEGCADDVLDMLLDQEGVEVDPLDRLEKDTPLHKAVRFVNGLAKEEWEAGASIVELLLDAGADPRYNVLSLWW